VRLPNPVVEFIDTHLDKTIRNRSEFLQHWAQVGIRGEPDELEVDVSHARHARREEPIINWAAVARGDTDEAVQAIEEARVVPTFPVEEPAIMEGTTVVPTTPRTGDPQLDEIYGGMLEGFRNRIR
jgi:hypothetical protein